MSGWYETESSEVVWEGHLGRLRVDQVRMPDGSLRPREIAEHLDAVAVVPLDDDGHVVLVRQYRHAFGRYQLEIPAGVLDVDGEAPADAVRRELLEETGLVCDEVTELVAFANSAGWSDETTRVYVARHVRPGRLPDDFQPEAEEADMEVVKLPLAEAVAMAERGEIPDAKTLVGLLLVRDAA